MKSRPKTDKAVGEYTCTLFSPSIIKEDYLSIQKIRDEHLSAQKEGPAAIEDCKIIETYKGNSEFKSNFSLEISEEILKRVNLAGYNLLGEKSLFLSTRTKPEKSERAQLLAFYEDVARTSILFNGHKIPEEYIVANPSLSILNQFNLFLVKSLGEIPTETLLKYYNQTQINFGGGILATALSQFHCSPANSTITNNVTTVDESKAEITIIATTQTSFIKVTSARVKLEPTPLKGTLETKLLVQEKKEGTVTEELTQLKATSIRMACLILNKRKAAYDKFRTLIGKYKTAAKKFASSDSLFANFLNLNCKALLDEIANLISGQATDNEKAILKKYNFRFEFVMANISTFPDFYKHFIHKLDTFETEVHLFIAEITKDRKKFISDLKHSALPYLESESSKKESKKIIRHFDQLRLPAAELLNHLLTLKTSVNFKEMKAQLETYRKSFEEYQKTLKELTEATHSFFLPPPAIISISSGIK